MKGREFLMWLHERLEKVHGEDHLLDYMHKLRARVYLGRAIKFPSMKDLCPKYAGVYVEWPKDEREC